MTFRVGQKVVCVNAKPINDRGIVSGLTEGTVYTVRWIGVYTHPTFGTEECILLAEVVRDCFVNCIHDMPSRAMRFRPIVERKTDISVFTKLLNTKPAKINRIDAAMHDHGFDPPPISL